MYNHEVRLWQIICSRLEYPRFWKVHESKRRVEYATDIAYVGTSAGEALVGSTNDGRGVRS
jgi:hypothetical protein